MASGEKLRLWEAGVGIALVMFPDYRGPNQQSAYVLPLPYFIYRGERLKVDYNGSRGVLFDPKRLHPDLSINASAPGKSDDNDARRGMPNLDSAVELGPVLKYYLTDEDAPLCSHLELPVRAVIATDFTSFNYTSWLMLSSLWLEAKDLADWDLSLGVRPIIANDRYHDYFYGVAPESATP
jgi:MipA family protein